MEQFTIKELDIRGRSYQPIVVHSEESLVHTELYLLDSNRLGRFNSSGWTPVFSYDERAKNIQLSNRSLNLLDALLGKDTITESEARELRDMGFKYMEEETEERVFLEVIRFEHMMAMTMDAMLGKTVR